MTFALLRRVSCHLFCSGHSENPRKHWWKLFPIKRECLLYSILILKKFNVNHELEYSTKSELGT